MNLSIHRVQSIELPTPTKLCVNGRCGALQRILIKGVDGEVLLEIDSFYTENVAEQLLLAGKLE